MKRIACALCLVLLSGLAVHQAYAQNATYLQGLFVGSEGAVTKEAPGAEEGLETFHNELLQALGLRSRGNTVLALTSLGGQSAFDRIAAMQLSCDSNDVAVIVALGGWQKNPEHVELSFLSSVHKERLTLDYLLNLMLFLPARTLSVFVLAPPQSPFPVDLFQGQRPGIGGGGKYLVVLQPKNQGDFESSVDAFHDLLEKSGEAGPGDRNGDGILSFTEWLGFFESLATAEFAVLPYRIIDGPDIQLKQLH